MTGLETMCYGSIWHSAITTEREKEAYTEILNVIPGLENRNVDKSDETIKFQSKTNKKATTTTIHIYK